MRTIKFRAKHSITGLWHYGVSDYKPRICDEIPLSIFWKCVENDTYIRETVQEFVEFTNHDGSKGCGFEGDIISHGGDNHNGVIRFKDGEFYVVEGAKDANGFLRWHGLPPSTSTVKIIGNVIDNPKLKYRWGRS